MQPGVENGQSVSMLEDKGQHRQEAERPATAYVQIAFSCLEPAGVEGVQYGHQLFLSSPRALGRGRIIAAIQRIANTSRDEFQFGVAGSIIAVVPQVQEPCVAPASICADTKEVGASWVKRKGTGYSQACCGAQWLRRVSIPCSF